MFKNILIIGGSGFVGKGLCLSLKKKFNVTNLDIKKNKIKKIKYIKSNISNFNNTYKAIKKNDIIVLCAAMSDINISEQKISETVFKNIYLVSKILEIFVKFKNKKFIYLSSIYVNGKNQDLYKFTKITSENLIVDLLRKYKKNYVILRLPSMCGLFSRGSDVMSIFKKNIKTNKDLIIKGHGNQMRNFLFNEDFSKQFHKFLSKRYNNKILNIFSEYSLSINNLARIFTSLSSNIKVVKKLDKFREDDFDFRSINIKKLKNIVKIKTKDNINNKIKKFIYQKK